jgi:hypothetical protein
VQKDANTPKKEDIIIFFFIYTISWLGKCTVNQDLFRLGYRRLVSFENSFQFFLFYSLPGGADFSHIFSPRKIESPGKFPRNFRENFKSDFSNNFREIFREKMTIFRGKSFRRNGILTEKISAEKNVREIDPRGRNSGKTQPPHGPTLKMKR